MFKSPPIDVCTFRQVMYERLSDKANPECIYILADLGPIGRKHSIIQTPWYKKKKVGRRPCHV